jgi:hypothetical protein
MVIGSIIEYYTLRSESRCALIIKCLRASILTTKTTYRSLSAQRLSERTVEAYQFRKYSSVAIYVICVAINYVYSAQLSTRFLRHLISCRSNDVKL